MYLKKVFGRHKSKNFRRKIEVHKLVKFFPKNINVNFFTTYEKIRYFFGRPKK